MCVVRCLRYRDNSSGGDSRLERVLFRCQSLTLWAAFPGLTAHERSLSSFLNAHHHLYPFRSVLPRLGPYSTNVSHLQIQSLETTEGGPQNLHLSRCCGRPWTVSRRPVKYNNGTTSTSDIQRMSAARMFQRRSVTTRGSQRYAEDR